MAALSENISATQGEETHEGETAEPVESATQDNKQATQGEETHETAVAGTESATQDNEQSDKKPRRRKLVPLKNQHERWVALKSSLKVSHDRLAQILLDRYLSGVAITSGNAEQSILDMGTRIGDHLYHTKFTGKPFPCHYCEKAFADGRGLKKHCKAAHCTEELYKCGGCEKSFTVCRYLIDERRTYKTYDRGICEKPYAVTSTGLKIYNCNVCDKSFKDLRHLRDHSRTHTGERPYKCNVCQKAFAARGTLKEHSRIHTGEKPYKCAVCEKAFTVYSSLRKHNRSHTGEKPFACDACGKAFAFPGHLKEHIRIHTGEKPYTCEICAKTFAAGSSYRKHVRTQHNGEKTPKAVKKGGGAAAAAAAAAAAGTNHIEIIAYEAPEGVEEAFITYNLN